MTFGLERRGFRGRSFVARARRRRTASSKSKLTQGCELFTASEKWKWTQKDFYDEFQTWRQSRVKIYKLVIYSKYILVVITLVKFQPCLWLALYYEFLMIFLSKQLCSRKFIRAGTASHISKMITLCLREKRK